MRDIHLHFEGEFPRVSSSLKWNGPNDIVANINTVYSRAFTEFSNDEDRNLITGIDQFRDFDDTGRDRGFELGGDIEFPLGSGTLKLIGLYRHDDGHGVSDSTLLFADASPATGNRFASEFDSGERIARSEYRWDMLGGNWEVDMEAAFNFRDQDSQFFNLEPDGLLREVVLPNSCGKVTEDRYEVIVTHGRTLAENLTLQLGAGGENSTLAQTGPGGLTREFWRPKGSMSLAWTPGED
jgi:hypothetical protein